MHPKIFQRVLVTATLLATLGLFLPSLAVGQQKAKTNVKAGGGSKVVFVTPSGLKFEDLKIGAGEEAEAGKIVEVHYVGWLEDGTRFDSSRDRALPFTFRLGAGDALKGWDEGLVGMKVGGKRKLIIPPDLGFGNQAVGSVVPPNSVLFYEFELLAVREDPGRSR
jgi:FKBP-type peptidyl-prolyl cis-trans isomerase